jgi:hypothetical protein
MSITIVAVTITACRRLLFAGSSRLLFFGSATLQVFASNLVLESGHFVRKSGNAGFVLGLKFTEHTHTKELRQLSECSSQSGSQKAQGKKKRKTAHTHM